MTDTAPAEFYQLPAHELKAGMSTADGQYITAVWTVPERWLVGYDTYTPRPDDPAQDEANQCAPDGRIAGWDELVDLAVFEDTEVDGQPQEPGDLDEDELEKVPDHHNDLGDWCPDSGTLTADGTCPQYCREADEIVGFDAGERDDS